MPPNPIRLIELLLACREKPLEAWLLAAGCPYAAHHSDHWCLERPHCDLSHLMYMPLWQVERALKKDNGINYPGHLARHGWWRKLLGEEHDDG